MPIWIWFVALVGGLLGFGAIMDVIAKKKNLQLNPDEGIKNVSDAEQIYTEQYLQETRDNFNHPHQ